MRHLLKNKDADILVNDSYYPISQVQYMNKGYTSRVIKWADHARQSHHINGQPINRILHSVDNNILQKLTILREDVRMAEYIYEPSITHLKGKTVRRNIQHV